MQTLYDIAGLAAVAYGEVLADGTSPNTNSGVATARTALGRFTVTLPDNIRQSGTRDLIFVQPKRATGTVTPLSATVDDSDAGIKRIDIHDGSTFADAEFTFLILRTIVTPPTTVPPTPG